MVSSKPYTLDLKMEMNLITSNIYLGGKKSAENYEGLKQFKITHILDLMNLKRDISNDQKGFFSNEFIYLVIDDIPDDPNANISKYFATCNDFLRGAITQNPENCKVLVHCQYGISRSATIVIIFMMSAYGMSLE